MTKSTIKSIQPLAIGTHDEPITKIEPRVIIEF
jgi:hypothetical protein